MAGVYRSKDARLANGVRPEQRSVFTTQDYYRPTPAPRYFHSQAAGQRNGSNYSQFVDTEEAEAEESEAVRRVRKERQRKRTVLLNRVFAILFCVAELVLGAVLIAFGAARISVFEKPLTTATRINNVTVENAVVTATLVINDGIFIVACSLAGIVGFAVDRRGLKMAHIVFATIALIGMLEAIAVTAHEISDLRLWHRNVPPTSAEQFSLNIALLILIALALFILLQTTILQSAHGFVTAPNIRGWPIAHLIAALLTTVLATVLVVVSAVALHEALSKFSSQSQAYVVSTQKRDVSSTSLVVAFYIWAINFWAIAAFFARSRLLSLTATVLYIPGVFSMMFSVLSAYPRFIPALHAPTPSPYSTTIYYFNFGLDIALAVSVFLTLSLVSLSVFKR